MNNKFILWACGIVILSVLSITSWGVVSKNLEWPVYISLWSGIIGTLAGYVFKTLEIRGK